MSIELILAAAIAFSLSQVGLSVLLLLRIRLRWTQSEHLLFWYLVTAIAYLLFPFSTGHWLQHPILLLQTLLPGMFWLFCASVFDDRFELNSWKITLVAATVFLPVAGRIIGNQELPVAAFIFYTLPQTLEFIVLGLALIVVVQYWRDDLLQARRNLRFWFCAMTGLFSFTLIFMREVLFPGAEWLAIWQYVPVGVVCLVTNLLLLQYKPELIEAEYESPARSGANTMKVDISHNRSASAGEFPEGFTDRMEELMGEQHIYRKMGLTIGKLAKQFDLPEYKLRKIINTSLGYRNFSDFLNGYRIREAGERLIDPAHSSEPILNIALDTGFRSLSSFNKAFKSVYHQTPTEYRNTHQTGNTAPIDS